MMRLLPTATVRGPEGDIKDIRARLLEERHVSRAVVREFVAAVGAGDQRRYKRILKGLELEVIYGWRKAMRAVANTPRQTISAFGSSSRCGLSMETTFAPRSTMTSF
jgi:hypothetical protein